MKFKALDLFNSKNKNEISAQNDSFDRFAAENGMTETNMLCEVCLFQILWISNI